MSTENQEVPIVPTEPTEKIETNPYAGITEKEKTPEETIKMLQDSNAALTNNLGKAEYAIEALRKSTSKADPVEKVETPDKVETPNLSKEDISKIVGEEFKAKEDAKVKLSYDSEISTIEDDNLKVAVEHVLKERFSDDYKKSNPPSKVVAEAQTLVLALAALNTGDNSVTKDDPTQNQFGGGESAPTAKSKGGMSEVVDAQIEAFFKEAQ